MRASSDRWHPWRLAIFVAIGAFLYLALFLWSDALLRANGRQNPFLRVANAPADIDWIILGASHALPLGFADMPETIRNRTGQRALTLALPGGGPFTTRLVAERWFADHRARGVLIILDSFGFADDRWNAPRMADSDVLPKIPADRATLAILAAAVPRGLSWQTWVSYATGFARINDQGRFRTDQWPAEARFATAPRSSAAATRSRIDFLFPGPVSPDALAAGMADLAATVRLARARGAVAVIVLPPLPETFRSSLPPVPDFHRRLHEVAAATGATVLDHSALIPEPRFYFDADHLNRDGVLRWLDLGLEAAIASRDDDGQ